eukprot:2356567-Amphidinium_carterae.1
MMNYAITSESCRIVHDDCSLGFKVTKKYSHCAGTLARWPFHPVSKFLWIVGVISRTEGLNVRRCWWSLVAILMMSVPPSHPNRCPSYGRHKPSVEATALAALAQWLTPEQCHIQETKPSQPPLHPSKKNQTSALMTIPTQTPLLRQLAAFQAFPKTDNIPWNLHGFLCSFNCNGVMV